MKSAPCIVIAAFLACLAVPARGDPNVVKRGTLENARIRFQNEKRGHVAFLGGSITEMDGYRPLVMEGLKARFPETEFTFTNAGVASTCSTTGAFRLKEDVLDKGPVDLLLVEFAVNDDQDAHHSKAECVRGMEGIVRQVRRHNPRADIVIVYFVNEHLMDQYRKRETPVPIAAHEEVAAHYGLSTINLARTVTDRIDAKELTWGKFGGVHPAPFGNRLAADRVQELFDACWKGDLQREVAPGAYPMPAKPLDPLSYAEARYLDPKDAKLSSGWKLGVPDWAALPGGKRDRFTRLPILEATGPRETLAIEFTGTALGAYLLAGPDAGMVEVQVDGDPAKKIDLWHPFSAGLHYPRTLLWADGLKPGRHLVVVTVLAEKNAKSTGTAVRIVHLVANG